MPNNVNLHRQARDLSKRTSNVADRRVRRNIIISRVKMEDDIVAVRSRSSYSVVQCVSAGHVKASLGSSDITSCTMYSLFLAQPVVGRS